jgi:hypothetical protein
MIAISPDSQPSHSLTMLAMGYETHEYFGAQYLEAPEDDQAINKRPSLKGCHTGEDANRPVY